MHLLRALLKSEIILLPAIDVDGLRLDLDFVPACNSNGLFCCQCVTLIGLPNTLPVIDWEARHSEGLRLIRVAIRDQGRALHAHRTKKIRMSKCKAQRAIAAMDNPVMPLVFRSRMTR